MAVVVVTGASSGIGAATARELAGQGHRLVLAARRADRLAALAEELGAGAEVLAVPTDVTDPQQVDALAEQAVERFGRIDVWINNAGVGQGRPWFEVPPEDLRRMVDTNLTSVILGGQAAVRRMLPQGSGHIINVASVAGHVGVSGIYSATKFGVRGHSEAARRELAPYGIRVSIVSPGFVRTEMTEKNPLRMPGPEVIALAIARLIQRPRREVVVPWTYRVGPLLNALSPALLDLVMAGFFRKRARRFRDASRGAPQNGGGAGAR